MSKFFLGLAILFPICGGVVRADEQSDAIAILDAGIKAQGGETAMGKPVGLYYKSKGTTYDNGTKSPISVEMYCAKDKLRFVTFDENNKITEIEVVNGKEGWKKSPDQAADDLSSEDLKADQESIYENWATMLVPLKAKEIRLSVLDDVEAAGHKAVGILVRDDKHEPLKLYFNKETHLLAKLQCKTKDVAAGREYDQEIEYSDYRDAQDTKQPFKVVVYWNGTKNADYEVKEMSLSETPLSEKLFSKP